MLQLNCKCQLNFSVSLKVDFIHSTEKLLCPHYE